MTKTPLTLEQRFARLDKGHRGLLNERVPPRGTSLFYSQGEFAEKLLDYCRESVLPLAREVGGEALEEALRWESTLENTWDFYWGG